MRKYNEIIGENKRTHCHKEFTISKEDIIPLNDKETPVPYNVMSFDIEASSSHGDFPIPVKSYKKLATNIVDYFDLREIDCFENPIIKYNFVKNELREIIQSAFGFIVKQKIDLVYPKILINNINDLNSRIDSLFQMKVKDSSNTTNFEESIEKYFSQNNATLNTKDKNEDVNDDDNETEAEGDSDSDGDGEDDVVEVSENTSIFAKKNNNTQEKINNDYNKNDVDTNGKDK